MLKIVIAKGDKIFMCKFFLGGGGAKTLASSGT